MATQAPELGIELSNILGQPLTPEGINDYAANALEQLVGFVQRVTIDYAGVSGGTHEVHAEAEDAAFQHFNLPWIGEVLDHLGKKNEELSQIDDLIKSSRPTGEMITPTDSGQLVTAGTGEHRFVSPTILPRLKTVLFVLQSDFGINVHDESRVLIQPGEVTKDMVRRTPYYFVTIPELKRSILICDETGNVTYVFDSEQCHENGLVDDMIKNMTKTELNECLGRNPHLGCRIVYNERFVDNVSSNLLELNDNDAGLDKKSGSSYLVPPAPEGYMSTHSYARSLNLSDETLHDTIDIIREELGVAALHRYNRVTTDSWSSAQQALLYDALNTLGFVNKLPSELYPEVTKTEMANVFKVDSETDKAISGLGEDLGPTNMFRFGPKGRPGYDPWQQNMVFDWLKTKGYFVADVPETYLSTHGIAKLFEVSERSVYRNIELRQEELGPINTYKFGAQRAPGYDPWQQNILYDGLNADGLIMPKAPDDVWSVFRMQREWNTTSKRVMTAIRATRPLLGTVRPYKISGRNTFGYDEFQRAFIRQNLIERGVLDEAV